MEIKMCILIIFLTVVMTPWQGLNKMNMQAWEVSGFFRISGFFTSPEVISEISLNPMRNWEGGIYQTTLSQSFMCHGGKNVENNAQLPPGNSRNLIKICKTGGAPWGFAHCNPHQGLCPCTPVGALIPYFLAFVNPMPAYAIVLYVMLKCSTFATSIYRFTCQSKMTPIYHFLYI